MSLDQLYLARPLPSISDYRAPIKGLYLCGSGSHPGWFSFVTSETVMTGRALKHVRRMNQRCGQSGDSLLLYVSLFCPSLSCRGRSDGLSWLECGSYCHKRPKTQLKEFYKHSFIIVNSYLEGCRPATICHPSSSTKHSEGK